MVSIGPYTQSTDMKQMYNFADLNCLNLNSVCDNNTIMDIISKHPDLTIFNKIIEKAQYTDKLYDLDYDFTIFVPSDTELEQKYTKEFIYNIDKGFAIQILNISLMKRSLDKSILQTSQTSILPTLDRSNSIYIKTIDDKTSLSLSGNIYNNYSIIPNVISWNHIASNGIIHITDNLLTKTPTS